MNKVINFSVLFICTAIGVLLYFSLTHKLSCGKPAIVATDVQVQKEIARLQDSMYIEGLKKDEQYRADSTEQNFIIDSLESELFDTRQLLQEVQKGSTHQVSKLQTARKNKDTAGYTAACDSLAVEVTGLNQLVDKEVAHSDSVKKAYQALQRITASRLGNQQKMTDAARSGLLSLRTAYNGLRDSLTLTTKQLTKAERKANRKTTLSLSIGYGVGLHTGSQQFIGTPFVGITLSRTLLRLW